MSNPNEIKAAVELLDHSQQLHYNTLVENAEGDPFAALQGIESDMRESKIEPRYLRSAALARTALNTMIEGGSDKPDLSDSVAGVELIQEKIEQAEAEGRTSEAEALRRGLDKAVAKSEAEIQRAGEHQALLDAREIEYRNQRVEKFLESFQSGRETMVESLLLSRRDEIGNRIERPEAEELFERESRERLEQNLYQRHSVSASEVKDYQASE